MSKTYRFKFEKKDRAKFTGHLDCLQTFQRAIKRANLPIAYSQGFNPHQQIAFAQPLSLGYTTVGDYGDFKLTEELPAEEVKNRLNEALPKGLQILEIRILKEGVKHTMSSICAARYKAVFHNSVTSDDIRRHLIGFFNQTEIVVMKKTKKGICETNIKADIMEVYLEEEEGIPEIGMLLSAGSVRNLKPESVAEAFCHYVGKEYSRYKMNFERKEMYMEQEGQLVPLSFGVEKE